MIIQQLKTHQLKKNKKPSQAIGFLFVFMQL